MIIMRMFMSDDDVDDYDGDIDGDVDGENYW